MAEVSVLIVGGGGAGLTASMLLAGLGVDSLLVSAVVRDRASDQTYEVRASFLLACDGGRTIGPALGIEQVGVRGVGSMVSMHVSTDLSGWAGDPEVLIRWTWIPHKGTLATIVPMGPTRWGPDSEEWVIHLNYPYEDPRSLDDGTVEADMRDALGIGDHPVDIHLITRWELMGVVASRLRVGRTFLLGDAAHRHPPTGGLGLTSATQDVHNLCWKLATVLAGHAGDGLLDTYEPERRSSVQWNVDNSLDSALNHLSSGVALGLADPDLTPDDGWTQVATLWSGRPEYEDYQASVERAIRSQSMEFRKHNVEYGYTYDSAAVVPDGTPAPDEVEHVRAYAPSTPPGAPLRGIGDDGALLVRPDRFVAWRSPGPAADPTAALAAVLDHAVTV